MSEDQAEKGSGWKAFVDKETGRTYYHNSRTNETSWTKPEAYLDANNGGEGKENVVSGGDGVSGGGYHRDSANVESIQNVDLVNTAGSSPEAKKKKKKKKKKKNKRKSVISQDTANDSTASQGPPVAIEAAPPEYVAPVALHNASQDEANGRPPRFPVATTPQENTTKEEGEETIQPPETKASTGDRWTELVDHRTGRKYYYNEATRETSWDPPAAMPMESDSSLLAVPVDQRSGRNRLSISRDDSSIRLAFEKRSDSFLKPLSRQNSLQSYTEQSQRVAQVRQLREYEEQEMEQCVGERVSNTSCDDDDDDGHGKKAQLEEGTNSPSGVKQQAHGANRLLSAHQRLMERRRTVSYQPLNINGQVGRNKSNSIATRTQGLPAQATGTHTMVSYANKYLQQFKRGGLFKRRRMVSPEKTVSWSAKPLMAPLHTITNVKHQAVALQCFDIIMQYMGDKKTKKQKSELAKELLEIALLYVQLRNEICCQLIKQCTKHPKEPHVLQGLKLIYLLVSCFPPSVYELQEALLFFLQENQRKYAPLSPHFEYAKQTEKILRRMVATGPRKTLPKSFDAEITQHVPIFGVTIEEYMDWQLEIYGRTEIETSLHVEVLEGDQIHTTNKIIVPKVLEILMDKLLKMDGFHSEGLFRKPGSTSEVEKLKDRFSNGDLSTADVQDVHTVASLLKLWLRELVEPIIPDELYSLCIEVARDKSECLRVLGHLSLYNRSILIYVCQFLNKMIDPEVSKHTKMTIENLAVVFSPNIIRNQSTDPLTIMKNSPLEQEFVRNLILQIK